MSGPGLSTGRQPPKAVTHCPTLTSSAGQLKTLGTVERQVVLETGGLHRQLHQQVNYACH